MDEQNISYTYSGISFSLKKEQHSDPCYRSWGYSLVEEYMLGMLRVQSVTRKMNSKKLMHAATWTNLKALW
jgi:hypothetical protein